jgi:hypothetical protein
VRSTGIPRRVAASSRIVVARKDGFAVGHDGGEAFLDVDHDQSRVGGAHELGEGILYMVERPSQTSV